MFIPDSEAQMYQSKTAFNSLIYTLYDEIKIGLYKENVSKFFYKHNYIEITT